MVTSKLRNERKILRLSRRIWQTQVEKDGLRGCTFPCERALAQNLGITRHAVRQALQVLEAEGKLVRLSRRASVPAVALSARIGLAASSLRCITFLRGPALAVEPLRWLVEDHLAGYTEALEAYDIKMRFVHCLDNVDDCESLLWPQVSRQEQGCVLVGRIMPHLLNWLRTHQVPFVVQHNHAYPPDGLPEHDSVFINKTGGGFKAVQHLIELGHRRIGFVGNRDTPNTNVDFYEGYAAAMKTHGLPILPELLCASPSTNVAAEAQPLVTNFLRQASLLTALVAENDTIALAVLRAAHAIGLRVPRDLSVVGYNDQAEAALARPPLTTMRTPRRELAHAAVDTLLARVAAPAAEYRQRILECELVVRDTTATPRQLRTRRT